MARNRVEIVSDILKTVKNEGRCKKTTVIRLANLDWNMASEYLDCLVDDGFLESIENDSKGDDDYTLTEKGEVFLKSLKKVRKACSIL